MRLWLLWVLATAVAFGVGGRLGVSLNPGKDLIVTGYFALSSSLLLAGLLQWLLLRAWIPDARGWVLASVGAVLLVAALVFGLGLIHRDVGWVLGVILGWIALGGLQWLVLRGQVPGAGWWVAASALGLALAIPAVALATWATGTPTDSPPGEFLRWAAFGAAYGVVTATALWWLLRDRIAVALP